MYVTGREASTSASIIITSSPASSSSEQKLPMRHGSSTVAFSSMAHACSSVSEELVGHWPRAT